MLKSLLQLLDTCALCSGHPEEHFCNFVRSKKGQLSSRNGRVTAVLDSATMEVDDKIYQEVPTVNCCHKLKNAVPVRALEL